MLFTKLPKRNSLWFWKQKEHKDIFTHKKNFKDRIHDKDIIFRILPRLPKVNDWTGG